MPALALLPLFAAGWISASAAPVPSTVLDAAHAAATAAAELEIDDRVAVSLFDENHTRAGVVTVKIGRDGAVDDDTRKLLEKMFRCKRTDRRHKIDAGLLAMIADVAARYPGKTLEYVSAYRALDSATSRHHQGRAFDFRIEGISSVEIRDYVWTKHREVGVGWYPENNFVHIDHRPGDRDYAWTQTGGREHGNPFWAAKARREAGAPATKPSRHRAGV